MSEELVLKCYGTDGTMMRFGNGNVGVGLYCPLEDGPVTLMIPKDRRAEAAKDFRALAAVLERGNGG